MYEVISHLKKFRSKAAKINEFKKFNKQQLYVENTFSLERITLSNLVEKLRFLLFFDLKRDYKSNKNKIIITQQIEHFKSSHKSSHILSTEDHQLLDFD
jgi:hypothetical protein